MGSHTPYGPGYVYPNMKREFHAYMLGYFRGSHSPDRAGLLMEAIRYLTDECDDFTGAVFTDVMNMVHSTVADLVEELEHDYKGNF